MFFISNEILIYVKMHSVLYTIICLLSLDFISYSIAEQTQSTIDTQSSNLSDHFIKVPQKYLDFPWHVGIYNMKKKFVCGGVIISPHLVLSASHCFYNEMRKIKPNAENYEIVVSKVTVDYSVRDNEEQTAHKINKILFADEGPAIPKNNYANDIVILIVEEPIAFGSTVSPACLDWAGKRFQPQENTQGTVVGIIIYPDGNSSKTFQSKNLPFISLQDCLKTLPEGVPSTLTSPSDKFCAGFEGRNADETIPWGSGAGLVFPEGSSYYVRGLLNSIPSKKNNIAAFTDLTHHIEWISKMRDRIEPPKQNFTCGDVNPAGPHGPLRHYWDIPK